MLTLQIYNSEAGLGNDFKGTLHLVTVTKNLLAKTQYKNQVGSYYTKLQQQYFLVYCTIN